MLIPSIDLMNGKLVQLIQGKDKKIELENPISYAQRYSRLFDIQLIDLDSTFEKGNNLEIIKEICKIVDCRVGGGIRTIEKAEELIKFGAKKVIIGTKANKEFLEELSNKIGKEKIIVALDAKRGKLAINGWREETDKDIILLAKELEDYCSEYLYTCIEKEGLMGGSDMETILRLKNVTSNKISLAGGIATIEEINEFDELGVDCVVGMAIYSGKLLPENVFIESLDFKKMNGLIPTIIKDEQGNVLILVYSNKASLERALAENKPYFFSRSRNRVCIKGETSGNTQELIEIKTDCDKDALLFIVKQKGNACHLNQYSCFEEEKMFDLEQLYNKIKGRINSEDEKSYTRKLVNEPELLKRKLIEEAAEVITAKNKDELIWECADLLYFLIVIMAKEGISIEDVEKENGRRDKETLLNSNQLNASDKKEIKWKPIQ